MSFTTWALKGKFTGLYTNKKNVVAVKTPVGVTEEYETGEGVAQGSVEGASICAASLGAGVNDIFKDSSEEVNFTGIQLELQLYQDDVARLEDSVASVQAGNARMEALAKSKLLDFNLKNSCYIIIGNKSNCEELWEKIKVNPIMLCS